MSENILEQIRAAATKRLLFLPHAIRQMSRTDRMITSKEVERAVTAGEIVEDYPGDIRGHSCLLLGFGEEGRPIHVLCSPKDEYVAVITAYVPDPTRWSPDFKRRL